jgi:hypothetical protein
MDGKPSGTASEHQTALASTAPVRRSALAACVLLFLAPPMIGRAVGQNDMAVSTQGGWAYTQRNRDGAAEYMAATRAGEDDVWLVLGCGAAERLTVSAIHSTQFPFPLNFHASVRLHSRRVPSSSAAASGSQSNALFIDPNALRRILPLLIQDDTLFLSIPEQNGTIHEYTFSMQPNDVALKPIRLGCLNDVGEISDEGRER